MTKLTESEQIAALTAEKTPQAAAHLRALAETAPDKETRKEARRALFRLQQAGITPAASAVLPRTEAAAPAPETETLEAYASAFDGAGNRLLFFVVPERDGGRPTLIHIRANDEAGIEEIEARKMPRQEVRERIERFQGLLDNGLALAEIEADYGRWLLSEARQVNQRLGRPTPRGFLEWHSRIGEPHQTHESAAIYAHLNADEIRSDLTIPRDPDALFALLWFDAWFFAAEEALPYLAPWLEAESGVVVVTESVKQARRDKLVKEAAEGMMPPEVRQRYVSRLEESAEVLRRRGKMQEAKQVFYHALSLAEAESVGDAPFAQALVTRTIDATFEMLAEQQQAQEPIPQPLP